MKSFNIHLPPREIIKGLLLLLQRIVLLWDASAGAQLLYEDKYLKIYKLSIIIYL